MTLLPTLGNFLSGIPVILFLSCLPALLSENWNRFRGPDGKGVLITEDFANSWTEKDYAWSCKLPGVGHSSPVLWGEKLFTTCASESTGEQFVLCWMPSRAKSFGKKLSFQGLPAPQIQQFCIRHSLCRLRVRFVSWTTKESNDLLCLDHNGALVWRRDFGRFQTQHGNGFSPSWKAKSWSSPTTMK